MEWMIIIPDGLILITLELLCLWLLCCYCTFHFAFKCLWYCAIALIYNMRLPPVQTRTKLLPTRNISTTNQVPPDPEDNNANDLITFCCGLRCYFSAGGHLVNCGQTILSRSPSTKFSLIILFTVHFPTLFLLNLNLLPWILLNVFPCANCGQLIYIHLHSLAIVLQVASKVKQQRLQRL